MDLCQATYRQESAAQRREQALGAFRRRGLAVGQLRARREIARTRPETDLDAARRIAAECAQFALDAAAGIGIAALGELTAEPYLASGSLVPIMVGNELPPVGIYIVHPQGQHLARKVRVLIDLLVENSSATQRA